MKSRISFVEPASKPGPSKLVRPSNSESDEESYLQELIRAGIVTHKFKATETFDAMFAVSEIHELAGVTFVAAFKHGVIFLGCPDGAPESIADLVEKVDPSTTDDKVVSSKLDAILERTEALQLELDRRNEAETLSKNLSRASRSEAEKMQIAISELSETIAGAAKNIDKISRVKSEGERTAEDLIAELGEKMSVLTAKLEEGFTHIQGHADEQAKERAALSGSMEGLQERFDESTKSNAWSEPLQNLISESADDIPESAPSVLPSNRSHRCQPPHL